MFRNLIKRPKDQVNNLWVAEATENSEYSISYDLAGHNYLKDTATSILKWAKTSSLVCLMICYQIGQFFHMNQIRFPFVNADHREA